MADRRLVFLLLVPPYLYLAASLLPRFAQSDLAVAPGFLLTLLVAGLGAAHARVLRLASIGLGTTLVGAAALTLGGPGAIGASGADLVSGMLVGVPFVLVAVAGRAGEALPVRLLSFGGAASFGILLLASGATLAAGSTAVTGSSFLRAFGAVNADQLIGIAGLVGGAGSTYLPAHDLFDPIYAALFAPAVIGLLLTFLDPVTGGGEPLPVTWEAPAGPVVVSPGHGFTPAQVAALRAASRPLPPTTPGPPGLDALLVAAGATGVFVAVGFAVPFSALLATILVLAGASIALAVVARRPQRPVPRAGPPAAQP